MAMAMWQLVLTVAGAAVALSPSTVPVEQSEPQGAPVRTTEHILGTWRASRNVYEQEFRIGLGPAVTKQLKAFAMVPNEDSKKIDLTQAQQESPKCAADCGEHGTCYDFTDGSYRCKCDDFWTGENCQTKISCRDDCHADKGRGKCKSLNVCDCSEGFGGLTCEKDLRCPEQCNGHGECMNAGTECFCDQGWTGTSCGEKMAGLHFAERKWARLWPPERKTSFGKRPAARHSHAAARVGDETSSHMIVFGGISSTDVLVDMWEYDTADGSWSERYYAGSRPLPAWDFSYASDETALYVFGGWQPCKAAHSSDMWRWRFETEEWTMVSVDYDHNATTAGGSPAGPAASMLSARSGASLTSTPHGLVLVGGKGTESMLGDCWLRAKSTGKWHQCVTSGVSARMFHTAVADVTGTSVYLFGGMDSEGTALSSFYRFNVSSEEWMALETSGPAGRFKHSSMWREDRLYVFGGRGDDASRAKNDIWTYDPANSKWEELAVEGTAPRLSGASGTTLLDTLVFFGGRGDRDHALTYEVTLPTPKFKNRLTNGDVPARRLMHAANVVGNHLYLFGGETVAGAKLNDMWGFNLQSAVWERHTPRMDTDSTYTESYTCPDPGSPAAAEAAEPVPWPAHRAGHSSAVGELGGIACPKKEEPLLYFGGQSAETDVSLNDLYAFCWKSGQFIEVSKPGSAAARPSERSQAGMLVYNKTVYIFGGLSAARKRLNDLWTCSGSGKCSEVYVHGHKHPHSRRSMSFMVNSYVDPPQFLVYGGYWKPAAGCGACKDPPPSGQGTTDRSTDVWKFETQYQRWRKMYVKGVPEDRFCPGAVMVHNKMFQWGGYRVEDGAVVELEDLWYFDPEYEQWRNISVADGPRPAARHEHTFDIYRFQKRQHAVVYGGIGASGAMNDVWVTDITNIVDENYERLPAYNNVENPHTILSHNVPLTSRRL